MTVLVKQQTLSWLKDWVIALNLCPFAAKVVNENTVRIAVCELDDERGMIQAVLHELDMLVQENAQTLSTSLLVFTQALSDFEDYLDFADWANDLLIEAGLEGIIQIATFHPDYQFENTTLDDVENFTNRSPYPTLHFIREQEMETALANYPEPENIPQNNIQTLKDLGLDKVRQMLGRDAKV